MNAGQGILGNNIIRREFSKAVARYDVIAAQHQRLDAPQGFAHQPPAPHPARGHSPSQTGVNALMAARHLLPACGEKENYSAASVRRFLSTPRLANTGLRNAPV